MVCGMTKMHGERWMTGIQAIHHSHRLVSMHSPDPLPFPFATSFVTVKHSIDPAGK